MIFFVVVDYDVRVMGKDFVFINNFYIFGVILNLGKDVILD